MLYGIILAGGYSSRMKTNKALLAVDNKPLILFAIDSMRQVVDQVVVVTGRYHDEINELLKNEKNVKVVYNPDYEKGMFTSVLAGVKHVKDDLFVSPVDCPFVKKETFEALLSGSKEVRFPRYQGQDGHPLFISKSLINELLNTSLQSNLREFRNSHDYEAIEVNDKNVLIDIDTMSDYQNVIEERR